MKPKRTVITRSPRRSVGAIHEPWFQPAPIQHESQLEKRCIEVLLLTPGVVHIESQPLTIEFSTDGKKRHYTPDFRVTLTDGTQALVEAKGAPYEKRFRDLLDAGLRDRVRSLGLPLYAFLGRLEDPERSAQASTLRAMARRTPPYGALPAFIAWLSHQKRATVGDAEQAGHPLGLIGHAVGRRMLTVGPSFDLAPRQPLHLTSKHEHIHVDHWLGYPGRAEDVAA